MSAFGYTLLTDGSSDQALLPILNWLLDQHGVQGQIAATWADLRRLASPPHGLAKRIQASLELYPCELLFVHRDAEAESRGVRVEEIQRALRSAQGAIAVCPTVGVVPVRMTEAWLLFDAAAIRTAAGNSGGRQRLRLPALSDLERDRDPKETLYALLRAASGRRGRRLDTFRAGSAAQRVAGLIGDFSVLRSLPAFAALEQEIERVVQEHGWNTRQWSASW